MKQIDKYHIRSLEIIEKFKKGASVELISKNSLFSRKSAKLKPLKNKFHIDFEYDLSSKNSKKSFSEKPFKGLRIKHNDSILILEKFFINRNSPPNATGSVSEIHTLRFSKTTEFYHRLIIPLENKFDFHFYIEETVFTTDLGYRSRNATTILINETKIQVCCIHNESGNYFLSIDSETKQTFNEFSDQVNTALTGLGYITGHYVGNQGFLFQYARKKKKEPKNYRITALRESIRTAYSPISTNAYGRLPNNTKLAEKFQNLLRPVNLEEFSTLCDRIHKSVDFAATLMLILESSSASLLFMPGGYAIALETISDLIIDDSNSDIAPIPDKKLGKKIRKELLEVINQYSTELSDLSAKIIKTRIENFNQVTNSSRLQKPFDILKIKLTDEDLKVLLTRNDFLHGRAPDITNAGPLRSLDRINKDLFYSSMRFYTLLNMIILKWIGYDNRVVNYPKIHESVTEIRLKEDPFRQV